MQEVGIDIGHHSSKNLSELMSKVAVQYAIFVCSSADDRCPSLAQFSGKRQFWPFEDPAVVSGTHEEKLASFRKVRDQIDARITEWLAQLRAAGELSKIEG